MPVNGVPVQAGAVVATAAIVLCYGWYLSGRGEWLAFLRERFVYGVPWGTLVTVTGVVAFYLFAQGGLSHWNDPVTIAFRNWAYRYTPGMLTSGFAHASPGHLLSNVLATLILAPIAEYAWGHYPPSDDAADETSTADDGPSTTLPAADRWPARNAARNPDDDRVPDGGRPGADRPEREETGTPADHDDRATAESTDAGQRVTDTDGSARTVPRAGESGTERRYLDRPWVRALVVFPAAVVAASLLTSVYALGWSLGFSGAVFVFLGFVLLRYPMTTVVAMVGITGLNVLVAALREPVLRATTEPGGPGPPAWAGVNVQAHMLGFLVGVALGLALLWARDERPDPGRVLFATVLVVLVRRLWALALGSDGVFYQYRAIGVVFVFLLGMVITTAVAVENERLTGSVHRGVQAVGFLWLGVVAVGSFGVVLVTRADPEILFAVAAIAPLLAVPALPVVLSASRPDTSVTYRHLLVVAVLLVTVVVALPSIIGNAPELDEEAVPDDAVAVGDYQVAYAEDATHGRIASNDSGLVVVSERRSIWTVAVSKQQLSHRGNASVPLGGIGWRTTVDAQRRGWNVVGNDTVYVVDIVTDDRRVRSFRSAAARADVRVENRTVTLTAGDDGFGVDVTHEGTIVGSTPLPAVNGTTTAGGLTFVTERDDETTVLFVETDDVRVPVARKESF